MNGTFDQFIGEGLILVHCQVFPLVKFREFNGKNFIWRAVQKG